MAPPGTKVLIHETLQQRRTWEFHGKEAWYIGTSPLHYRCYRIYIPETWGERITKIVQFFHHNGAMPDMLSADATTDAARRLADALANPAPTASFARFETQTMDVIRKLADIFAATSAQPLHPTPPPRRTRATVKLPRLQHNTDSQAPLRVPPTVPPSPPDPPTRVDTPASNPPNRYPLRSRSQDNHTV